MVGPFEDHETQEGATVADLIDYLQSLDAPECRVYLTADDIHEPGEAVLLDFALSEIEERKS